MSRSTVRLAILVLGLITALVHLVVLNVTFVRDTGTPDLLFTLNGLGYLGLLAAFFGKLPWISDRRTVLHYLFIGYTAVTILAWAVMGARNFIGYATKIDELLLIAALWMHLKSES
ncbi:MAG: hypothetical protein WD040_05655 [Anaerolineales bacterium]